jgi:hypothetical protein
MRLYGKNPSKKRAHGVGQGEGPEFKPTPQKKPTFFKQTEKGNLSN